MSFDVDIFVDNLSKTELYSLTKPQLKLAADKVVNMNPMLKSRVMLDYLFQRSNFHQITVKLRSDNLN